MNWSIVKVYYADGEDVMFRVVGIDKSGIISRERVFHAELDAEKYLLERKTKQALGI